jgi:Na+/proline symporter
MARDLPIVLPLPVCIYSLADLGLGYASGATVQILLFATIAIELKRRAPNAHTFLEVIKARYGVITHAVCSPYVQSIRITFFVQHTISVVSGH